VEEQNATCLACHKGGQRLHWPGSAHDTNNLGCSDCHNAMARFSATGLLRSASISETCQTCHGQQRAEFRKRSHMPVPEGKMSCSDCHSPHGSPTRPLLRADTVNDVCYACHAEKRGPLLWEHAPVRENCLNCHNAHGSNHDKLLVARAPLPLPAVPHLARAARRPVLPRDQTRASALAGGTQSPRIDRALLPELPQPGARQQPSRRARASSDEDPRALRARSARRVPSRSRCGRPRRATARPGAGQRAQSRADQPVDRGRWMDEEGLGTRIPRRARPPGSSTTSRSIRARKSKPTRTRGRPRASSRRARSACSATR
jgi:predicted CXXCH cytochrome family protein